MEIIKLGLTPKEFDDYVDDVAAKKMRWAPRGVVLHNTWNPTLAKWPGIVKGKQISVEQRLENTKAGYVNRGWRAGPHLFIDRDKIWLFTPLWDKGLHSPSWNSTHFGVELVGNFEVEQIPDTMKTMAISAIKSLYRLVGKTPTDDNFHFHKEDPKTTHKTCPGPNVGSKESWLDYVRGEATFVSKGATAEKPLVVTPVEPPVVKPPELSPSSNDPRIPNDRTVDMVKRWEAFRAEAYQDGARQAIGYGRNEGHRGFVITPGMRVSMEQASDWLREDLAEVGVIVSKLVKVPLNDNQFGALCSLGYNIGTGNLGKSTIIENINAGDFEAAAKGFLRWNKARNKEGVLVVLPGLTKRRTDEKWLFQSPVPDK
jgi:lysozyme